MLHLKLLFIFLTIKQASFKHFRRHTGPPPFTDWELGLRESVHQALLREHHTNPTLRNQLLEAPLLGRQNNASPFGDIAVLGRGQLYVTPDGLKFVQDSDQDDCDCVRCVSSIQCQFLRNLGHHNKLLALWTVKRIRHRDPDYGHTFEIEYTISPITPTISEEFVTRHGYFNYNVPGHIFVIRSNPHLNERYDKWKNQDKWSDLKPIVVGVTPDGYKHVLHSFPGFYTSYRPQNTYDHTTIDPKEYELYKKLIQSLASKTSSGPHRFSVTTEKTTPTFVPIPQTTFLQLLPIPSTLQPTRTPFSQTTPTKPVYNTLKTTVLPIVPTPEPPKPMTMPVTTIHYYTPIEVPPKTTTSTTERTTKSTTFDFDVFTTTLKATKTPPTEVEEFDLFPVRTSTEPMQPVTELPKETKPVTITQQLPPPKDFGTTLPYVTSTVTQATTIKIDKVPKTTVFIPKNEIESTTVGKVSTATTKRYTTVFIPKTERLPTELPTQKYTTFIPKVETTVVEKLPSTTQKYMTVFIPKTEATTVEKVPLTERTTLVFPATTERQITTSEKTTKQSTSSTEKSIPSTTFIQSTTPYFTILTEPVATTQRTNQPTTIVTYFDTTTKPYKEMTTLSGVNTLPGTTTNYFSTTEPIKYTIPATTTYYYAVETEEPKTTTKLNDGTTVHTTPKVIVSSETSKKTTDFLSDFNYKPNVISDSRKDVDADDIFGKASTRSTKSPETTTKKIVQSDIEKALFGGRQSKQIKISSKVTQKPTVETTKIIYADFYEPSTQNPYATTEFRPSTDQSFSTSISFEVNKRNSTGDTRSTTITTEKNSLETKKAFDDLALRLMNHARGLDYMHKKPTSSRGSKYRRRSYSTRTSRRKVVRRKNDKKEKS